ncbi:MAG: radical SAM/SPASM domain-containing protein [Vicinamibacterales bacterium]
MPISHVLLFLTYRCNLRCDFCLSFNRYWRADASLPLPAAVEPRVFLRPARDFREMSTADIVERVIPQCEKNGVEAIALSGGEVLVRRDAPDIFRALGASSMRWCFDSNLMMCNEEIAGVVIASRCDAVFVSIDGTEDIHNRLRCNPKGFERTLNGLRCLVDARRAARGGQTSITINCVLQPGNESVPEDIVRLALDEGADELSFQLLSERAYMNRFDAQAAAASLGAACRMAEARGLPAHVYPLANPNEESLRSWFSMPLSDRFFNGCTYIHTNLRIDPEGNVIPCLEYALGNILEQELSAIWTGDAYETFRRHLAQDGPFEACLRCCNMTVA